MAEQEVNSIGKTLKDFNASEDTLMGSIPSNPPRESFSSPVGEYFGGQKAPIMSRKFDDKVENPLKRYDQFTLAHGDVGVMVHRGWLEWDVTRIEFEKKYLYDKDGNLIDDVNSLKEQEEIDGVKVLGLNDSGSSAGSELNSSEEEMELTPENPWKQLNWWGEVWAVIELDAETGKPVHLTIEGPEKPSMKPIRLLNDELSRGSDSSNEEESGSGSGGSRFGYSVLIGICPQNDLIDQRHIGPLQWFLSFIPEAENSSSGSSSGSSLGSSKGSSSASSVGGASGSSKDTAIHPSPEGGYRKWYAMEATEVLFFDFQDFIVKNGKTKIEIDPIVVFSCEPNSIRAFASPDMGTCNVVVNMDQLVLTSKFPKNNRHQLTSVMLKGVRRGFANIRLAHASFIDFVDNECRLNPRMTREEIIQQLGKMGVVE